MARAVGWPLPWSAVVHAVHALTARTGRRTMHRVHGLVVVLRMAWVLFIKGSLSFLHLGTHDPIRLLITRSPGMIWVLRSWSAGGLSSL